MKRAILIGAAPTPPGWLKRNLKALKVDVSRDIIIGVDGGANACIKAGVMPTLAIGDWDSGTPPARLRKITLQRDKDCSDLAFSIGYARLAGASEMIALAVTGARPDHHLAALFELSQSRVRTRALGPEADYYFLSKLVRSWRLVSKRKSSIISVFALGGVAKGVTLTGMRYPLKRAVVKDSSIGLSNVMVRSSCKVEIEDGRMVAIVP